MNRKTIIGTLIVAIVLLGSIQRGYANESRQLFSRAQKEARSGALDFAFMHYREILTEYPYSPFRQKVLFSQGEYLFWMSDYDQSKNFFNEYLQGAKTFEEKLFTLAYLFKIADQRKKEDSVSSLQKQIRMLKKHSFIFRDSKEYTSRTPLYHQLKAVYFIDRIEFYVDKKPFTKITY